MKKEIGFAVKSNEFLTYKRFRDDLEKSGWKWLGVYHEGQLVGNTCIWMDKGWTDEKPEEMCFTFSNPEVDSLVFNIDTEYGYKNALKHAEELFNIGKTFYYVVEREIKNDGVSDCVTNSKGITIYSIKNNVPISLILMNCKVGVQTEDVISVYLTKVGFKNFKLIKL